MFYVHAAKIADALGRGKQAEQQRKRALAFNPSFKENAL
jgi:hypothetical protein